jgi:hypothetical protein
VQVWWAIDPLMLSAGVVSKTSQSFFACTGCCLQYR